MLCERFEAVLARPRVPELVSGFEAFGDRFDLRNVADALLANVDGTRVFFARCSGVISSPRP
jgi:hypothetical protein